MLRVAEASARRGSTGGGGALTEVGVVSGRVLVVDGYNVIRESPRYRGLVDEDLSDPVLHDVYVRARQALVADVAAFAQGNFHAVIVFDGFGNPDPERPPRRAAGVDIVFSPSGVEADAVIERLVTQHREAGHPVTVVSSDAAVQSTVFGNGVDRLSSRMFENETVSMREHVDEMRVAPATGGRIRTTVADRLPVDVRVKLKEMALPRKAREAAPHRA